MKTLQIKNPWYNPSYGGASRPFFEVPDNGEEYRGYYIYETPLWALAVKDGVAVTQCVTVRGAKTRLDFLLRQAESTAAANGSASWQACR